MKELSLHILDLVENSITAGAKNIDLTITENVKDNILAIAIKDDGCGMTAEKLTAVSDPFYTTRTTRNVGLGIPMFKMNTAACDGQFNMTSQVGVGTKLCGTFRYDHIDRAPLGDMAATITAIFMSLDSADLIYMHSYNDNLFKLDSKEMRQMLGDDVPLSDVAVLQWVEQYVTENLQAIRCKS